MSLPFRLYVISDRARMMPDPVSAVLRLARAGLPAFQWREKDLSPAESHEMLGRLQRELGGEPRTLSKGPRLFVNDRADLALALGLNVHLTESSLPTGAVRSLLPPGTLLGRSTHSLSGAQRAQEEGADFVTFGPVYDTPSKRAFGPPLGLEALKAACQGLEIPVLAIGGVHVGRIPECLETGAHGAAVIGAVWDAPNPAEALSRIIRILPGGPGGPAS